jgi:hypothetical protein
MLRVVLAGALLCAAAFGAQRPSSPCATRAAWFTPRRMERKEGDRRILYDDGLPFEQQ